MLFFIIRRQGRIFCCVVAAFIVVVADLEREVGVVDLISGALCCTGAKPR